MVILLIVLVGLDRGFARDVLGAHKDKERKTHVNKAGTTLKKWCCKNCSGYIALSACVITVLHRNHGTAVAIGMSTVLKWAPVTVTRFMRHSWQRGIQAQPFEQRSCARPLQNVS